MPTPNHLWSCLKGWVESDSEALSGNSDMANYHCLPYFFEKGVVVNGLVMLIEFLMFSLP